MKKLMYGGALIAAGSLLWSPLGAAHGGTYRGPGDTVPPAGGGGGGGGAPATSPGATTPGPTQPGRAGSPGTGAGGGVPGNPPGPTTGGGLDAGPDLTLWQYWWGFNKEPYLNLKRAIFSEAVLTHSPEFYLGEGQKDRARDSLAPSERTIRDRIVPALEDALATERQNDILDACLIALAKIGDSELEDGSARTAERIKRFLPHASQQLSETAAISLGILASDSPENVGLLLSLFEDDTEVLRGTHRVRFSGSVPVRTRAFAGFALGLIGHSAGEATRVRINAAMAALLDGEGKQLGTRDVQVAAITAMGLTPLPDEEGAPLELKHGKRSSGWPRPAGLSTRADQVAFLMNYFEDPRNNFLICAHVPTAVARLVRDLPDTSPLRVQVAGRFLEDTRRASDAADMVKQSCVQALGVIGDCDDDPIDVRIRASLMDVGSELADRQAEHFALIALGQVAGRPGRGEGDPLAGLAVQRNNPRTYLMTRMARDRSETRPWAALGLAVLERSLADARQMPSEDALRALRAALSEARSPTEVGGYAIALGIARDGRAHAVLREKLERTSEPEARGYCAVALGMTDDRGSIDSIQAIVTRSKYQPDLLKSAAIGLGLLGDKKVVPTLIEMLDGARGLASQAALASALGFIGDHRSVDPLIAMLEDDGKTALARGFAAAALGIVADKETLPWNAKVSVDINYRANTSTLTAPQAGTGILDLL